MRDNDVLIWLLQDQISSTTVTADANGNFLTETKYTAFGEIRSVNGETVTDKLYTGQQQETELGLDYYVARFYDPQIAHFVQPDSIIPEAGSSKGYDRYLYANSNPVNRTDPSGHFAPLVGAAVGAIVGFSVDILIQTVPQMMNGTSPLDVNINWAEAGGAAVAGLASGLTLGVAAALVPAGATVGTSIATMSIAGGVGNSFGNQVGAITSGVIEHGFTQEGAITARDKYGFGDWKKLVSILQ